MDSVLLVLQKGHMSRTCKKCATCSICKRRHPTVLHSEENTTKMYVNSARTQEPHKGNDSQTEGTEGNSGNPITIAMVSMDQTGAGVADCKLAIMPVKVKANKGSHVVCTYAFLDPGSSATFCTERIMEKLHVSGMKTNILLKTMGHEKRVKTYRLTELEVGSLNGNSFIDLPGVFTQSSIPVSQENIPKQDDIRRWPYLNDVHLDSTEAEVDLLVGVNVPKAMEPLKVDDSQADGPYAVQTCL